VRVAKEGYNQIRMEDIRGRVVACVTRVVSARRGAPVEVTASTPLKDHLDSFRLVQLVVALEEEFGLRFARKDLLDGRHWRTAEDVCALLRRGAGSRS
jgi:acyl carrier protein